MNVIELIKLLEQCDPYLEVHIPSATGGTYSPSYVAQTWVRSPIAQELDYQVVEIS